MAALIGLQEFVCDFYGRRFLAMRRKLGAALGATAHGHKALLRAAYVRHGLLGLLVPAAVRGAAGLLVLGCEFVIDMPAGSMGFLQGGVGVLMSCRSLIVVMRGRSCELHGCGQMAPVAGVLGLSLAMCSRHNSDLFLLVGG